MAKKLINMAMPGDVNECRHAFFLKLASENKDLLHENFRDVYWWIIRQMNTSIVEH